MGNINIKSVFKMAKTNNIDYRLKFEMSSSIQC